MNTQWLLSKWGECMLKSCAWSKMMVFQCACVGKQWQTGSPLREVLFCGRGGMPENPSLLLASNISWEKQLETKSRAEPWIFKGTLGTFQFGLSSLGAQDTKDPTFEVNSIVSFGLCCLTSQSSKSICITFIILKSFLCLFPPYFFFFSQYLTQSSSRGCTVLILSVQLSTSFLWLYTQGTLLKRLISSLSIVCFHMDPLSHS